MIQASQLQSVSSLLADVLWWDFNGLDPLHEPTATTFISPPISWRPLLIRPDFITAMLEVPATPTSTNQGHWRGTEPWRVPDVAMMTPGVLPGAAVCQPGPDGPQPTAAAIPARRRQR